MNSVEIHPFGFREWSDDRMGRERPVGGLEGLESGSEPLRLNPLIRVGRRLHGRMWDLGAIRKSARPEEETATDLEYPLEIGRRGRIPSKIEAQPDRRREVMEDLPEGPPPGRRMPDQEPLDLRHHVLDPLERQLASTVQRVFLLAFR